MSVDPEAQTYLDATAALGLPSIADQGHVEARRMTIARIAAVAGEVEHVAHVEDRNLPGPAGPIPVRVYANHRGGLEPVAVFLHGGGWVTGNLDTHDGACRGLAARSGAIVVAVDFRSAPEHPFPAAVEDAWAVIEWLAAHGREIGADPSRIAVVGDSAGGNLAAVVALRARDRGGPRIAAQVLVYPVTDFDLDTASYRDKATGYGLTRDSMRWYWQQYLGENGDPHHPEASPLRASSHAGLAPALVITCEHDPLRDEGDAYAAMLAAAGVPVEHLTEAGMIHGYFRMAGVISRARKSWDDCAAFLRREFARA